MAFKQIAFFAVESDLRQLLSIVESDKKFVFTLCGVYDANSYESYNSSKEIPELGIVKTGNSNQERIFLVGTKPEFIVGRRIQQKNGTVKTIIDQQQNPNTIVFSPGGQFLNEAVISGKIGTIHINKEALAIYDKFERAIKKIFVKIQSYYVGAGAKRLLIEGIRLTNNIKSPKEYDLIIV